MTAESDSDSSDGDTEEIEKMYKWQTIPKKRNVCKSPIGNAAKKPHIADNEPSTSKANRYAELSNDDDNQCKEIPAGVETSKPPPLFVPDVNDVLDMLDNLSKIIPRNQMRYKSLRNNEVKLMIDNVESYRKLTKHLEKSKISFHTYQIRSERSYRVVLKGIHYSVPVEDIKADLLLLGYGVRNVYNIKTRINKQPLSMFYVDLDPKPESKNIYEVNRLGNAVVSVEPPQKVH